MLDTKLIYRKADRTTREALIGNLLIDYGFLSRDTIGESRCSRPIDLLCIGNRQKQVLFTGAFHGMEWITSLLLLRFIDELCFSVMTGKSMCGVRIGSFLNRRGLAVVPCINPDGVEIQINGAASAGSYEALVKKASGGNTSSWQSNAAGVDINHNFLANCANWKSTAVSCLLHRHATAVNFPKANPKAVPLPLTAEQVILHTRLLFTVREKRSIGISVIIVTARRIRWQKLWLIPAAIK